MAQEVGIQVLVLKIENILGATLQKEHYDQAPEKLLAISKPCLFWSSKAAPKARSMR